MKKTYISPNFLLVELRCNNSLLTGSLDIDGAKTSTAGKGGFVKENNSTVSDVNVWDNEW
jgi:hypothetical protein